MTRDTEIMNVEEAAHFLRIHPKTLYRLTLTRKVPYFRKRGVGIRFIKSDLERWLREGSC
jgi:excisionase family DNA binding protein